MAVLVIQGEGFAQGLQGSDFLDPVPVLSAVEVLQINAFVQALDLHVPHGQRHQVHHVLQL